MAIKKVKLTEADLNRIVRKVIKEQSLRDLAGNVGLGGAYDAIAGANGKIYDTVRGAVDKFTGRDEQSSGGGGLSGLLAGGVSALLDKFRGQQRQRIENIANTLNSLQTKPVPDWVITNSKNPSLNGMTWSQFYKKYSLTPEIMQAAKALAYDMKQQGGAGGAASAVANAAQKTGGVKRAVKPATKPAAPAPVDISRSYGMGLAESRLNRKSKQTINEWNISDMVLRAINNMPENIKKVTYLVADALNSVQKKPVNKKVIVNPKNAYNGKTWDEYMKLFKVTPEELQNAKAVAYDMQRNAERQPKAPAARPTQGGVKRAVKPAAKPAAKPTTPATGTATAVPAAPATPAAQLSPDQLKAINKQSGSFNSQNLRRF
jgi:hypothetical protein